MDSESEHARPVISAFAGKRRLRSVDRVDSIVEAPVSSCETLARHVLLAQPGVAAVQELSVKKRWGRTRGVTACIRIDGGADPRDVCRGAAHALTKQLGAADVCLVAAGERGETVSPRGTT